MRHPWMLLGGTVLMGASAIVAAGPTPTSQDKKTAALITRLGDVDFAERQAASAALDALGAEALPALRRARESDDAEVSRRAIELIEAIQLREQTRKLLQPKKIRITGKDVRLREVLDELARKGGGDFRLADQKLAERKLTLDTGDVTYWAAVQKICEAAAIHEQPPAAIKTTTTPSREDDLRMMRRGRRVMYLNDRNLSGYFQGEGPTILQDGKGPALPATVHGALRVRAMPPEAASADPSKGDRSVPLYLEIKPEPHVSWEAIASVHIDRAVDDQGQVLFAAGPYVGGRPSLKPNTGEDTILISDGEFLWPTNRGQRQASLTLTLGKNASKSLREVRGTIAAWVRTEREEQLRVDNLAKSVGKRLSANDGSEISIKEIDGKDGLHKVKIEYAAPSSLHALEVDGPVRVIFMNRGNGPMVTTVSDRDGNNPFALLDAQGKALALRDGSYQIDQANGHRVYTLTYQAAKDQGPPARLIFSERRNAFVEVAFVLKDVPLVKGK
jgi:hypothetical protein